MGEAAAPVSAEVSREHSGGGGARQRGLSRFVRASTRRLSVPLSEVMAGRPYEITKDEWDEAISDALF